ncbi:hypothetical protein TrLO_g12616 [Triparma laevis f. longispina]|uniref:Uncharacterized protein n=1 Tax=Triparma laevis f. longispina TaxID=1714387 RepID=A0A9W7EE57_9STRA|nr:hypothetical protein TrLO_g12616 [Triparma laevis f. longispina]
MNPNLIVGLTSMVIAATLAAFFFLSKSNNESGLPYPNIPTYSKWDTVDDSSGESMTWYMDLNNPEDMKIHIITDNDSGTLVHEVFSGNSKYLYFSVDQTAIEHAAEDSSTFSSALSKVKENCEIDESWDISVSNSNAQNAFVQRTDENGNTVWQFGENGWQMTVDSDGQVIQIADISVNSISEYDPSTEVAGTFDLFETCDTSVDYMSQFGETMDEEHRRKLASMTEEEIEEERMLGGCDWWDAGVAYFKTGGTYGNYCGKGQAGLCTNNGITTNKKGYGYIEGVPNSEGLTVCADGGLDASCSKHDSGSYSTDIWGVMTMSYCEVDRIFKSERNNGMVDVNNPFFDGQDYDTNALNGANCLFDKMPCSRYESHTSWGICGSGWRKYPCRKVATGYHTKWANGNYPSGGCNGDCYK